MRFALLALLVGCTIPERDQTGPTIHIDLESSFEDVGDSSVMPEFSLDGDSQYSVMITISTQDGTETKAESDSAYEVETYNATFTIPNVNLTASTFQTDDPFGSDPTFTSMNPLIIPASAKGQSLKVHVDASDSRGLASNVIDFSIALK